MITMGSKKGKNGNNPTECAASTVELISDVVNLQSGAAEEEVKVSASSSEINTSIDEQMQLPYRLSSALLMQHILCNIANYDAWYTAFLNNDIYGVAKAFFCGIAALYPEFNNEQIQNVVTQLHHQHKDLMQTLTRLAKSSPYTKAATISNIINKREADGWEVTDTSEMPSRCLQVKEISISQHNSSTALNQYYQQEVEDLIKGQDVIQLIPELKNSHDYNHYCFTASITSNIFIMNLLLSQGMKTPDTLPEDMHKNLINLLNCCYNDYYETQVSYFFYHMLRVEGKQWCCSLELPDHIAKLRNEVIDFYNIPMVNKGNFLHAITPMVQQLGIQQHSDLFVTLTNTLYNACYQYTKNVTEECMRILKEYAGQCSSQSIGQ